MEIDYLHFPEIDSTNDYGKSHLSSFSEERLTVITADLQRSGRGRFGRRWLSPPHSNIYASFCFFLKSDESLFVTYLLALSGAALLEKEGLAVRFKFPNDLHIAGKKIAGVLCETQQSERGIWMVVGIGLNVNMTQEHLHTIDQPATSLLVEKGKEYEINSLRQELIAHFSHNLERFLSLGFSSFQAEIARLGH